MNWRSQALLLVRFRAAILLLFTAALVSLAFNYLVVFGDCGNCGVVYFSAVVGVLVLLSSLSAIFTLLGLILDQPWRGDSGAFRISERQAVDTGGTDESEGGKADEGGGR